MSEMNNNNQTPVVSDKPENLFFRASAADFKKIPGSPIAYWVSEPLRKIFEYPPIESITISDGQNKTGNNDKYVREHWEVSKQSVGTESRWFFYAKGGGFRKWYGNLDDVIDWSESARQHYRKDHICRIIPEYLWYKKGITWGLITSSKPSFRLLPSNATFDVGGSSVFFNNDDDIGYTLGLLNTKLALNILKMSNPTLNFQVRNIREVPFASVENRSIVEHIVMLAMELSKTDWDSSETSWDFNKLPLLSSDYRNTTLNTTYTQLRAHWQEVTLETQSLEEENNLIFIDAYGLQDELTPDVSLKEITLTCNPYYRYGKEPRIDTNEHEKNPTDIRVNSCSLVVQKPFPKDTELEERLLADTMKEYISYAVGCMFGRYALDKPGLILANQGETIADYLKQIPEPIFSADDDNVIPMLEGDWFTDDVTERFGQFLKVTFGDAHYEENLKFIEQALGKDIRKYFLKDFYTDHLKRYKKRPIYWLFSSPKGTFNALIYMHRYRPDTVSVVLNDYLREFRTKLSAHKNHLEAVSISSNASAGEKTKALKDIENHRKMIDELDVYEREVLYPLATEQVEIDLDDGVKVNYQKFGEALKKIPGLAAKED